MAAIGGAAVAKPFNPVKQITRQCPVYDRFATERSLALFVSGYTSLFKRILGPLWFANAPPTGV